MSAVQDFSQLNNLTQVEYIKSLLEQRLPEFYPDLVQLDAVEIRVYKKHFGRTSATYVAAYMCKYKDANGHNKSLNIFVSAHTDGSRQYSFANNSFLYSHGFNTGQYLIPRPLFYEPALGAFFYEGVRGRILKKLIKDEPARDLRPVLDLAAAWLRTLHNVPLLSSDFKPRDFGIRSMRPSPEHFINDVKNYRSDFGAQIENLLQQMIDQEQAWGLKINKTLVHGDYHLENIIVSGLEPDHIKVIDFTDLAWGDPCLDLAGFIQQFDFMLQNVLVREQLNNYKTYFIESYFNASFSEIDPSFLSRINLYQAWTTMRTLALLFYSKNTHHELSNIVAEAEKYLALARQQTVQININ